MYYTPKRPIKSFQDLEVYQKLLAVSVAVAKRILVRNIPLPTLPDVKNMSLPTSPPKLEERSWETPPPIGGVDIADVMVKTALDLPIKIATAHSLRFADCKKAIGILEEVMLGCNLLIVYLEQYRDIYNIKMQNAKCKITIQNSKVIDHDPLPKLHDVESKSLPKAEAPIAEADIAEIEIEFFEEQIKTLLSTRMKVMHLQMSWKKFSQDRNEEHV